MSINPKTTVNEAFVGKIIEKKTFEGTSPFIKNELFSIDFFGPLTMRVVAKNQSCWYNLSPCIYSFPNRSYHLNPETTVALYTPSTFARKAFVELRRINKTKWVTESNRRWPDCVNKPVKCYTWKTKLILCPRECWPDCCGVRFYECIHKKREKKRFQHGLSHHALEKR